MLGVGSAVRGGAAAATRGRRLAADDADDAAAALPSAPSATATASDAAEMRR
jgi:hypothetical protein